MRLPFLSNTKMRALHSHPAPTPNRLHPAPCPPCPTPGDKERLMQLLLDAMTKKDSHQARFCAVYWANRLFAFNDVRARYVCLLAVADTKIEVREEAERG